MPVRLQSRTSSSGRPGASIPTVFVANKYISLPDSTYVSTVRVGMGPRNRERNTSTELPKPAILPSPRIFPGSGARPKEVTVINPRGDLYTEREHPRTALHSQLYAGSSRSRGRSRRTQTVWQKGKTAVSEPPSTGNSPNSGKGAGRPLVVRHS